MLATKCIISNIKQAIFSRVFLFDMLALVALIFLSSISEMIGAIRSESLVMNGFHHEFIMQALDSNAITIILPIVAALPFTSSFIDDVKSGFVKVYLHRTTKGGYLAGKIIGCAISGGLVLALGIISAYVVSFLLFSPMEAALAKGAEMPGYFGELMGKVLLFFFSGAFWALVGMTFATLTNSKYMAYASPFVVYYVLIILYERYFDTLYVLYPKEWINPGYAWMWGNFGVVLLLLELMVIVGFCFSAAANRRLSQI